MTTRTLDPEAKKRAAAECKRQGIPLGFTDDLAIARLGRSLFEKTAPTPKRRPRMPLMSGGTDG